MASQTRFSTIFLFILMVMSLSSSTNSISFDFPTFNYNEQKISHEGDSYTSSNKVIQLTKNLIDENDQGSVGRTTYSDAILLWDSATGEVTDFETHFSFSMKGLSITSYGDGITFFLAPNGTYLPTDSAGGYLGLLNSKARVNSTQIVAVEFDSFQNFWDPSSDHVGINVNSVISQATVTWNHSMKDGRTANAWVRYNSITKNLTVYLSYADNPVFSRNPSVFHIVDLREVLPEWIIVGFSASTGDSVETHNILSWKFNSTLDIKNRKKNKEKSKIVSVAGLVVGVSLLSCGIGFALFIWLKKRRSSSNFEDEAANFDMSLDDEFDKGMGPKKFSYGELVNATNNFNRGGKLGEGGFGGVYKGLLSDTYVAVKRVSKGSHQGMKEYQSEVRIISRLRHRNLVQLIGWCHERNELLLVYEFMPNGSLDKHLFREKRGLRWEVRYKIALGLASALLYLHELWEQCVVHRDIKSSNVMLDSDFNAKLGDFGLARLVDHGKGSQTTVVAGTRGYLAPECFFTGKFSKESDIYSFGVVALEIACGRKPAETDKLDLVEWVWGLYGSGKIFEAADERVKMDFNESEMEQLMVVGLWCAHPDYKARPSITQVINVLKFESLLPKLPLELPTPVYLTTAVPSVARLPSSASLTDTLTAR
ncbi:hypothetical protein MKW94_030214 [Papaver nudicaule]|uniref:non-specific serine/threonine protein kinase n=1 Tax=Papaver nudicaule TaxID=74823 RepID=A0AA41SIV9_PAPNU|nr:hypothetical protein [Papaver nudicaule]